MFSNNMENNNYTLILYRLYNLLIMAILFLVIIVFHDVGDKGRVVCYCDSYLEERREAFLEMIDYMPGQTPRTFPMVFFGRFFYWRL